MTIRGDVVLWLNEVSLQVEVKWKQKHVPWTIQLMKMMLPSDEVGNAQIK